MSWTEQTIFFVDFEGSLASGILEYGVVALESGRVGPTWTRLCRATGPVRPEDAAVHGLRRDDVAGAEPVAADWEFFAGLRERGPLAAHYAQAENTLIKSVWPYPRSSPDFARPGARIAEWGPWIDTGRLYAQRRPAPPSGRLEDLVRAHGLQEALDSIAAERSPAPRRRYHAALYDALAGALLLARLAGEPETAGKSVGWLLAMSTLSPEKRDGLNQRTLFED